MADWNLIGTPLKVLAKYTKKCLEATVDPWLWNWRARRRGEAELTATESEIDAFYAMVEVQTGAANLFLKGIQDSAETIEWKSEIANNLVGSQVQKRISNKVSVVRGAAAVLENSEVEDHEPDPDWTAHFSQYAQDVSSEELQSWWSRILAGEIQNPGQTSLRTMSVLRDLSPQDASAFEKFADCVINGDSMFYSGAPNTTTAFRVVAVGLERQIDGSGDDGDIDELVAFWCGARVTKRDGKRASEMARARRFRANVLLQARSTRPERVQAPLFLVASATQPGEPYMCHHGERNMSIPTGPIAHFIVVQAGFAFGLFETLLNGVASRGDLSQGQQRSFRRCIGEKVGALVRLVQRASHQEPDIPSRHLVLILHHPLAGPVVDASSLFACGYVQTLPVAVRPGCDQRRDSYRSHTAIKNAFFARFATSSLPSRDSYLWPRPPHAAMDAHRQHIPTTTICHGISQGRRFTVDLVSRHPAHRHTQPPRMAQHRNRQFRLGGKTDVGRHFGFRTALSISAPLLRQIEPPIQKGMSLRGCIGQEDAQLTVLDFASRSAILTLYTRRFHPLLEKSRLVDYPDPSRIAEPGDHISLQRIPHRICVPFRAVHQPLRRIRPLVADRFRQLPAILPFQAISTLADT